MVGRSDQHTIGWQVIQLQQQCRDDALDLASFVEISAFLSDGVKLIEKEQAWFGADIVEQPAQSLRRLAKIARHDGFITHREQRKREFIGKRFGERRFTIARRPGQQEAMSGLHPMCTQHIGATLFLDQFVAGSTDRGFKIEVVNRAPRFPSQDAAGPVAQAQARPELTTVAASRLDGIERPRNSVGDTRMPFRTFIGGDRLSRRAHLGRVALDPGFHETDDEIAARHP